MMKTTCSTVALLFCLAPLALGRPLDTPRERIQFIDLSGGTPAAQTPQQAGILGMAAQDTMYFGGTFWNADSMRWEALRDSVWTFDTGVGSNFDHSNPAVYPGKDPSLHAFMEGWVGIDQTYNLNLDQQFRRLSQSDFSGDICVGVGAAAGLGGDYSFWAGLLPEEAAQFGYVGGQGYGNDWDVCISRDFTYQGGDVTLNYAYANETEPGYDFTRVYVNGVEAASYTGTTSGTASLALSAATYFQGAPNPVTIQFCVTSDGAWSDEDGLAPTACGAFAVDNIVITGGISYATDFETDDGGWVSSVENESEGDFSDIVSLADLPASLAPCECDLRDSVLVFYDSSGGHPLYQDNVAVSPWIDLKKAGLIGFPGRLLAFDLYSNLPINNYVFLQAMVQWYPYVDPTNGETRTSDFTSTGFIYNFGNSPTCTGPGRPRSTIDYSGIAPPEAEQIRAAIGVLNYCSYYGNCTGISNTSPWIDNVSFGIYGSQDAPLLNPSSERLSYPQDAFPTDGTCSPTSVARIDNRYIWGDGTARCLGDTLAITSFTNGGQEVRVVFAVTPGPGIDTGRLNSWLGSQQVEGTSRGLDWYSARMDTAEIRGIPYVSASTCSWMTAYHESDPNFTGTDTDLDPNDLGPLGQPVHLRNDIFPDDLLTPGSRLHLFYTTRYIDGTAWFTLPDTSGGHFIEMEVLPSSMTAAGSYNSVLYVNDAQDQPEDEVGPGARSVLEQALGQVLPGSSDNFEGTAWDRWDVGSPSSPTGATFGRPAGTVYGASLSQILGYDLIIWNSGNEPNLTVEPEDADILIPWLEDSGTKHFYLSGNNAASDMASSGLSPAVLLNDQLGVDVVCTTVREADCPTPSPEESVGCIEVDPVVGAHFPQSRSSVLEGNGCPQQRSFDVIDLSPTAQGDVRGNLAYNGPAKGIVDFASVSNNDQTSHYRSVVDGGSVHYFREPDCQARDAVTSRLADVFAWFAEDTDTDGDGIPDTEDACPLEAPAPGQIDRDHDGCPDSTSSFRMVKFWSSDQLPFTYETDAQGDPDIPGSDFTALSDAFATWTAVPGLELTGGGDDGTRSGPSNPASGDGRNSISFVDEDGYLFGTIAITPTAVATGDTTISGRAYRAGEIIDADILFNTRDFSFSTPSYDAGPSSFDLKSVAVHEFGHALGFSHCPIEDATMFYVVPRGTSAASLEEDDIEVARRGYGSPQLTIQGRVLYPDGITPAVGAAVFAIAASGDTTQMTFSGVDGTYRLYELSQDFRIYVHPLDGGADVNGLSPGAVNSVLAQYVDVGFLPEFLDISDTSDDFGSPGSLLTPGATPITGADIILNRDQVAPQVVSTYPDNGELAASAVGAVLVEFDEKLSESWFSQNPDISLRNLDNATGVGGVASLLHYGDRLAFTPSGPLSYDTNYELTIGPDLQDISGNPMDAAVVVDFRTRSRPAPYLETATPAEIQLGGVLVLQGEGFDPDPAANLVSFPGAAPVSPYQATLDRITVIVPAVAVSGDVSVTVGSQTSNPLPIQILPPRELPVGNALGSTSVSDEVNTIAVTPSGLQAYVATKSGLVAVVADPSSPDFLQQTLISIEGGANDVVALSSGNITLAISSNPNLLSAVDVATTTVVQQASLAGPPLKMSMVPGGLEVVITYPDRVVLHSAALGPTFGAELREWAGADYGYLGDVAVSADGTEIYATTTDGKVAILGTDPAEDTVTLVDAGTDPQEIVALNDGTGFVVGDASGTVRLFGADGTLLDTETVEGGFSGLAMSPEGNYLYGANLVINGMEILKVGESSLVSENEFATGADPMDCITDPTGRYVLTITGDGNLFEVYDTEAGPRISSVYPRAGGASTVITVTGLDFDPVPQNNTVLIGGIEHTPVAGDSATLSIVQDPAAGGESIIVRSGDLESNVRHYKVVNRPDPGNFVDAGNLSTGTGGQLVDLAESPDGALLVGRYADGRIQVMQADPSTAGLLRPLQDLAPAETGLTGSGGLLFANDGTKFYATDGGTGVAVFLVTPGAPAPVSRLGSVEDGGGTAALAPDGMAMTSDGRRLLVRSVAGGAVYEVDTESDLVLGSITGFGGSPLSMAVDPRGGVAFVGDTGTGGPVVDVVDIDPASSQYRTITATISLGATAGPDRLAVSPDATLLYAMGRSGVSDSQLEVIDVSTLPGTVVRTVPFPGRTSSPRILPGRSGTVVYMLTTDDPFRIDALDVATFTVVSGPEDAGLAQAGNLCLSRDDTRLYAAVTGDAVKVLDLSAITGLQVTSGFDQIGVAGEALPAPLVVQATGPDPALVAGGVVRFQDVSTSGTFGYSDPLALAAAGPGGFAEAGYVPGPAPGQAEIAVSAAGITETRFLTVVGDTTGVPPQIVSVRPDSTSDPPGVNTRIAVDFSKPIDPGTVNTFSFQVREAGSTPVPGYFTYANDLKRAVFTPSAPLLASTGYEIELTGAITDASGLPLSNPGVDTFTTAGLPPLALTSVFAPSGKIGIPVILSGTGFPLDAGSTKALFNEIEAEITGSDPGALFVTVPFGLLEGPAAVRVVTDPDTSNALPFVVLNPLPVPLNEVTDTVDLPVSGQRIAVTPDGTRAYMTSRDAGAIIPIVIEEARSEDPIPTGVAPYAVAISPDGGRAYVTNFGSNTISVVGTDPGNPETFHRVIATIPTLSYPTAIAVHPDGRTLYVVHYGDPVLSIIDVDPENANEFRARSQVDTGSTSKTVAVTPDGGILVVGTATGILVLNTSDGSARESVDTGSSSKSVAITPDGAFVLVLTDDDQIIVIDIKPGSPTEGQARSTTDPPSDPKDVKISPDGGFAYVTHEGGFVTVYAIDILAGEGAVESEAFSSPFTLTAVDTIQVGENPVGVALDPAGSGLVLVVNSGDKTITFINGFQNISYSPATVDIDPNVLNLQSNGQFVYANLQFVDTLDPAALVLSSVRLEDVVPADTSFSTLVDDNGDGILEQRVRFPRLEAFQIIPVGEAVPLHVTGMVAGDYFAGEDSLRVIRPRRVKPGPNDVVSAGTETEIGWEPVTDKKVNRVDIFFSGNGGNSWHVLGTTTSADSMYMWEPPDTTSDTCFLLLVARDSTDVDTSKVTAGTYSLGAPPPPGPLSGVQGYGGLDMPFTISTVTSVDPGLVPLRFVLASPRPNPSVHRTTIQFDLPEPAPVTIRIFSIRGSLVRELADGALYPAGRHEVAWDGRNRLGQQVGGGVYFLRLTAGKHQAERKIIRVR